MSATFSTLGLSEIFLKEIAEVEAVMKEALTDRNPLIRTVSDYLISSGGKRIRPMLLLAAASLCATGVDIRAIKLGAAVEFIHTATLLHDDVIDESARRRGKDAANLVWGNKAAVLTGDFLFSKAFSLMVGARSSEALKILSAASSVIAEGEIFQLTLKNTVPTRQDYMKMIMAKTAALFSAASEAGSVTGEGSNEERAALKAFGEYFGTSFQIIDDALDYHGDSGALGKNTGDDFREGKSALPVIIAYERGDETEKKFWRDVMADAAVRDEAAFKRALLLINRYQTVEESMETARLYNERALDALAIFPDGKVKIALQEMCRAVLKRKS